MRASLLACGPLVLALGVAGCGGAGREAPGGTAAGPPIGVRTPPAGRATVDRPAAGTRTSVQLRRRMVFRDPRWHLRAVAVADVSGDGRPDVVGLASRGVLVLIARGRGRYRVVREAGLVPQDAARMVVADLDEDGHADLATAGIGPQRRWTVALAFGGPAGFGPPTTRPLPAVAPLFAPPADVADGDVTGDGRPDLVVSLGRPGPRPGRRSGLFVLAGERHRSFGDAFRPRLPAWAATSVLTAPAGSTRPLLLRDLDGDGRQDVIVGRTLLRGVGAARFAAPRYLAPGPDEQAWPRYATRPRGHGSDLITAYSRNIGGQGALRIGTAARTGTPVRPARVTPLEPWPQAHTPFGGPPVVARLTRGEPEAAYDIVLAGQDAVWVAHSADGVGFAAAVPTVLPPTADRSVAVADLDGDGDQDVVSADANGRVFVLRNAGPGPLSRPVLASTGRVNGANNTVAVTVRCSAAGGGCVGRILLGTGRLPGEGQPDYTLALRPGGSTRAELEVSPQGGSPRVGERRTLQFQARVGGARRTIRLVPVGAAERAASCRARALGRPRLRWGRYVVLDSHAHAVTLCDRLTGRIDDLSTGADGEAEGPLVARHGAFLATVQDPCPDGFEGCYAGVAVQLVPSLRFVTSVTFNAAVGGLAVGAHGALAWVECTPGGTTDTGCRGGPYDVYRRDGRGTQRLAGAERMDPASLRAAPDGKTFSWVIGRTRTTARWRGAPR